MIGSSASVVGKEGGGGGSGSAPTTQRRKGTGGVEYARGHSSSRTAWRRQRHGKRDQTLARICALSRSHRAAALGCCCSALAPGYS